METLRRRTGPLLTSPGYPCRSVRGLAPPVSVEKVRAGAGGPVSRGAGPWRGSFAPGGDPPLLPRLRITCPSQPGPRSSEGLRTRAPVRTLWLLIFSAAKQSRHPGLPFTDEETEAQRCYMPCLRRHVLPSGPWTRTGPRGSFPCSSPDALASGHCSERPRALYAEPRAWFS